jgi:haloalkane dehalogenase
MKLKNTDFYGQAKFEQIFVEENTTIAFREFGVGEVIVFIHGFPTNGYTWRHLLPVLSTKFRCIILDLPGLGDSTWFGDTDFSSNAQAGYVEKVLKKKSIDNFSLVAHNSGATIARIIAINQSKKVDKLILFNTEIPNHRPPWIPFYQKIGTFPFVLNLIQKLLSQEWFIKSPMGFKEAYSDKSMLKNPENINYYLMPLISSKEKAIGAFKYLKGIDWKTIDDFKFTHRLIEANVLILWGESDKTFPLHLAIEMIKQFNTNVQFEIIKDTSLLPHEERPNSVINLMIEFLEDKK